MGNPLSGGTVAKIAVPPEGGKQTIMFAIDEGTAQNLQI